MFIIGTTPLRSKTAIKQPPYPAMGKTQAVNGTLSDSVTPNQKLVSRVYINTAEKYSHT